MERMWAAIYIYIYMGIINVCMLPIYMGHARVQEIHKKERSVRKRESNKEVFFVHKRSLFVATTLRGFVYRSKVSCVQECV